MAEVIIKMEMPKNCDSCRIMVLEDTNCAPELFCGCPIVFQAHPQGVGYRPDYCPLILVPPHGRLIDADALIADDWFLMKVVNGVNCAWTESKKLKDVPTIIPADDKDIKVPTREEGE